jgi:hypothetical protein
MKIDLHYHGWIVKFGGVERERETDRLFGGTCGPIFWANE